MKVIGWQGETRTVRLNELLQERFRQWKEGWFGQVWPDARIVPTAGREGDCRYTFALDDDVLQVDASRDIMDLLASAALGLAGSGSQLCAAVGRECFVDLGRTLCAAERLDFREEAATGGDTGNHDPRYGGLAFHVSGLPWELFVLANRRWCERQLPRHPGERPALASRREAIGKTSVSVIATIDLGSTPLLESGNWSTGELLVTDSDQRSAEVRLMASSSVLAAGRIGAARGKKTVTIF